MSPGHVAARLDAVVTGRVQGVGFRYFVLVTANRLGVVGWVANQLNGSVQCIAEGSREDLERLAEALAVGPAGALVTNVSQAWMPPVGGFDRFSIRSGGHRGD